MNLASIQADTLCDPRFGKVVSMNRTPVESSVIRSVGYDPVDQTLEVEFNTGRTYVYAGVPEEIYRELMASESKGRYMREYIIDQYPYAPISRTTLR